MSLILTLDEEIARARADLRMGAGIVLSHDGRSWLALAAETLPDARLASMKDLGRPVVALTARRAETLKAIPYDGDLARILLPREAGPDWIKAVADPADDLRVPMKGPLRAEREGPSLAHRAAIHLCKAARILPAAVLVEVADADVPAMLTRLDATAALARIARAPVFGPVISARVPLAVSEAGRVHVFRPEDGGEEHYAVEIGRPDRAEPVLARLHSACFTGDLLGSLKCDCGPQLRGALAQMGTEGQGVLLYLNQEGRGIGLANKMRAYSLQDQGFDTVEANHRLGFEDDERDFRLGAQLLRTLGFSKARLMTNNPNKMKMLAANGIEVTERVPLKVGRNPLNSAYLDTKAAKSGHLL
ncbi:GTP cyclohydrolase II [Poseidonocella sp. HB161398]|uniref:GTP cyclohydrolase II n=1 Tax=Poseidonocella sp. HB161398 TaxID=2320855 RepID=UPI00110986FF|nr:GTP cyclohydrolase II [Poseidonocella sp. HB161398]